jgi:hypothetical protein
MINKFDNKPDKNILRCRVCGRFAIREELCLHECRALKSYKIEGRTLQVFDGYFWYPLKLEQAYPTEFDRENFRRELYRTINKNLY